MVNYNNQHSFSGHEILVKNIKQVYNPIMFNLFNKIYILILIKLGLRKKKQTVAIKGKNINGLEMTGNKFYGFDKVLDFKNGNDIKLKDNESYK